MNHAMGDPFIAGIAILNSLCNKLVVLLLRKVRYFSAQANADECINDGIGNAAHKRWDVGTLFSERQARTQD
jgi:hypothetical protein